MKRLLLILLVLAALQVPAYAAEISAPSAPDSVEDLMPYEPQTFGQGLWHIVRAAIEKLQPEIAKCVRTCVSLLVAVMILSLIRGFRRQAHFAIRLAGAVVIACLLLEPTNSLIRDSADTITQFSEYGKLLLPVMTTALAAQGGVTASAAIYTATAFVDALLGKLIANVLIPMVYIYLCFCVIHGALGEETLKRLRDLVKDLTTWCLKTVLYVFTGYLAVTGVISGTADQTAVKAAKLTISGMVPVVGGILADASETILVSAGVVKSAAGTYGLLAFAAIAVGPFLNTGIQYLLLKATAALCGLFADKEITELIGDFSSAMGLLLAMTGTVCLIMMISTICFMKGMG